MAMSVAEKRDFIQNRIADLERQIWAVQLELEAEIQVSIDLNETESERSRRNSMREGMIAENIIRKAFYEQEINNYPLDVATPE